MPVSLTEKYSILSLDVDENFYMLSIQRNSGCINPKLFNMNFVFAVQE